MGMNNYVVPDRTHEALMNWARWCWQGSWPHPLPSDRCGSAEGMFQAPPEWGSDEAPEAAPIRPNRHFAEIVQRAWRALEDVPRLVLRAEYPARHSSGRSEGRAVAARRLGLTLHRYENELMMAVVFVGRAIEIRV